MKRHIYRTILIYGILALAIVYVYPTIGWMTLTETERQERLERWKREDAQVGERGYWEENWARFKRWLEFDRDLVINLGLDLQGGVQMVIGIDYDSVDPQIRQQWIDQGGTDQSLLEEMQQQVRQRIERRANEFGAKEPIIQTMGDRQIQVQLPGERDVTRAKNLILSTAYLSFHIVAGADETAKVLRDIDAHFKGDLLPRLDRPAIGEAAGLVVVKDGQIDYVRDIIKKAEDVEGLIPENRIIRFSRAPKPNENRRYALYLLHKEAIMTGDGLTMAAARPDTRMGGNRWEILFGLNASSGSVFGERTEQNIGNQMAIVVDGVVESAPVIQDRITTNGTITGNFNSQEAQDLAIALNSGSLPVPVREEQSGVTGPRLGADSIRSGTMSSMIGLILVMIFMVAVYLVAGLIANVALIMNALLILAVMAYLGATLTLPGIAGLILTIGMAVDANVLIYERIREELRNGKSLVAAIDGGYTRAFSAIMDSNVTTLIAAAVLLQFGSGPIEGFAVTLTIGVLTSVFTALVVTRALFDFLTSKKWLTKLTMVQLLRPDMGIDFLGKRRIAFILSAVLIVIGMSTFAIRGNENFGVDFTTGTNLILALETPGSVDVGNVRSALTQAGFVEPTVTDYAQVGEQVANRFMVHLGETATTVAQGGEAISGSVGVRVQNALAPLVGGDAAKVVIEKEDMVGPTVGRQLKWDAIEAAAYSIIFIIAYLWFRFELKFSVAAVIALLHDVTITLGLFALTGRQISLGVVAAVLTIIGYSLNDTIVVFDRLREDLKLYRGRGLSLLEIMNKCVNETLSRTLLTGVTTLVVVFILLIFGGQVINDFAFVLFVGVIVGTFSSVYIASPIVYYWQRLAIHRGRAIQLEEEGAASRHRRKAPKRKEVIDEEVPT